MLTAESSHGTLVNVINYGDDQAETERTIAAFFPPLDPAKKPRGRFTDAEIEHIAQLLHRSGKPEWSRRPRTYAILRLINRVDSMKIFVLEGLYDISFPYSDITLPREFDSVAARSKFLELQHLVFNTDCANLESGDGAHAHFGQAGVTTFESLRALGSGGFGTVDHVRSRLSLNEFARKLILRGKNFKRDKAAISDFERELSVLKRLSHRHLVKFVGSYSDPKHVGIIMSPVADCNLAEYLRIQQLPLAVETAESLRSFYGCLAAAVVYLHENQIRHKDIKPSNILLHQKTVLLTDFGTSLDWTDKGQSTTRNRPDVLSPAYCSPEVAAWEPRNSASDIWSLGCVFLEIASILKGQSLEEMREFFLQNGTGGRYIRTNQDAAYEWCTKLEGIINSQCDVYGPIQWAVLMITPNPKDRPTASLVYNLIKSFEGNHSYCGPCCTGEDEETDSTDSNSVSCEQVGSINDFGSLLDRQNQQNDIIPISPEDVEGGDAVESLFEKQSSRHDVVGETTDHSKTQLPEVPQQVVLSKPEQMIADRMECAPPHRQNFWQFLPRLLRQLLDVQDMAEHEVLRLLRQTNGLIHREGFSRGESIEQDENHHVVEVLIGKKADLEARIQSGVTALHIATKNQWNKAIRLLLKKGANVNARAGDGTTPLHLASSIGSVRTARLLIENGAAIGAQYPEGGTAIHLAVQNGKLSIFHLLFEAGLKAGVKTYTVQELLGLAVLSGHATLVQTLVEKGGKVEATTNDGLSLLQTAAKYGHTAVAKILLDEGADINSKLSKGGTTEIDREIEHARSLHGPEGFRHKGGVRRLLERKAYIEARNPTPLELAMWNYRWETVELLVMRGVAFDDEHQWLTVLRRTVEAAKEPMVRVLLEKAGALKKLNSNMGLSEALQIPLYEALKLENFAIAESLASRVVTITDPDILKLDVRPAIFGACRHGYEGLLRLLIERLRFNPTDVDKDGLTPLQVATKAGQTAIVNLLTRANELRQEYRRRHRPKARSLS